MPADCGCPSVAHASGAHPVTAGAAALTAGLPLPGVHHVGLVVKDRERTLAALCGLFGGDAFRSDTPFPPARFHTGIATARLKLGFVWMGGLLMEVIEPLDTSSLQGRFLQDHGAGMHHLGFVVPSIDAQLAALGRSHDDLIGDGTIAGNAVKWAYLDSDIVPGVVLELIEESPAAEQFLSAIYSATGGRLPG